MKSKFLVKAIRNEIGGEKEDSSKEKKERGDLVKRLLEEAVVTQQSRRDLQLLHVQNQNI